MSAIRAGLLAFVALLGACDPNPFCLNCGTSDGGGGGTVDFGGPHDLSGGGDAAGDGGSTCGDGGPQTEVCNNVDDDCNGSTDDVASARLQSDPNNCGSCFNVCTFSNAGGQCSEGKCFLGACQLGFYNLDGNPANGCEYACTPTPPAKCTDAQDCPGGLPCNNGACMKTCMTSGDCPQGTICDPNTKLCEAEVCDGIDNNCDGRIDEGIDKQTDANNCGTCANVCSFPNATGKCVTGQCAVSTCTAGYKDLNGNGQDGCEYKCPVYPTQSETCNGVDDDCDGRIDNDPTDVGGACDDFCPALAPCRANNSCSYLESTCNGKCCGICTQGTTVCASGQKVCQAGQGPQLEVCNNLDDNCDGQIDEGFDLLTDPLNCGQCGNNCANTIENAVAGCAQGRCAIVSCKPGYKNLDGVVSNGCEYVCPVNPPTVESCNGKDDDCNGQVDDNLTSPTNFCVQTGPCNGATPVCQGSAGWMCNYTQINSKIEVTAEGTLVFSETLCDGFDNNCNGSSDESFTNLGKECTVGIGACASKSTYACDTNNPTQTTCPTSAKPTNAIDELCNGVDDNCDGQTDERTPAQTLTCYNGGAHTCKGWVDPMVQVGSAWVYGYEASRPDATAISVGGSSARACARVGVQPWAPVTQEQAQAACTAVKDSTGTPMRLCTADEWQAACNVGIQPPTEVWSFATNPTTYVGGVCNGADANLGQPWVTGFGASCYANQPDGKIYDMSGNVAEWTSTQVVYNGATYYKVRGGAFNNLPGGLSCNFDFSIENAGYQYSNLGFRCCADNAP